MNSEDNNLNEINESQKNLKNLIKKLKVRKYQQDYYLKTKINKEEKKVIKKDVEKKDLPYYGVVKIEWKKFYVEF
jgi:SLT domain-containing protein